MSYFQLIDVKSRCISVFCEGRVIVNPDFSMLSRTWEYNNIFLGKNIEIAQVYVNGKTLDEVCPAHFKDLYDLLNNKYKIFNRSFKEAKINLKENLLIDLLPESFIKEYFGLRNEITEYIFNTNTKPILYNYTLKLIELASSIGKRKLNLNLNKLNSLSNDDRVISLIKKIKETEPKIKYNAFGSVTGRYTTKPKSFPILTLDKKFRKIIEPTNDVFIELDFNAADLRTFLALNNIEQPSIDIHDWHKSLYQKYFDKEITRDEIKIMFFAWLYNGKNESFNIPEIDNAYNREHLMDKYWNGSIVRTSFGKEIETEQRKAIPTLIQSTMAYIFFNRVLEIDEYIKKQNIQSFISCLIHDSVILDVKKEDIKYIKEIVNTFSNTEYGKFLTRINVGKNLGEMKQIKL